MFEGRIPPHPKFTLLQLLFTWSPEFALPIIFSLAFGLFALVESANKNYSTTKAINNVIKSSAEGAILGFIATVILKFTS